MMTICFDTQTEHVLALESYGFCVIRDASANVLGPNVGDKILLPYGEMQLPVRVVSIQNTKVDYLVDLVVVPALQAKK